jgi:hypothetical protein
VTFHYGIWHEAWAACCAAHNIDMTADERERCEDASKESYYNQPEDKTDG